MLFWRLRRAEWARRVTYGRSSVRSSPLSCRGHRVLVKGRTTLQTRRAASVAQLTAAAIYE
jgi:DNA-directed RNA polymerase subunit RPC12/RpoP